MELLMIAFVGREGVTNQLLKKLATHGIILCSGIVFVVYDFLKHLALHYDWVW